MQTRSSPGVAASGWLPGLDFVRATAIVLVVWAHGRSLLPRGTLFDLPWLAPAHWGIELFFALSGYLIVGQLVAVLQAGSWQALQAFCWKRFLRTLPAYWLVLALLSLALPAGIRLQVWLREALFLRTFPFASSDGVSLLAVNWSLAVEEMSYWLFAILAAVLLATRRRWRARGVSERATLAGMLLLLIGIGVASRAWAARQGFSLDQLKFSALLHVDALAYGGLARLWADGQRSRQQRWALNPWLVGLALLPLSGWLGHAVRSTYLLPQPGLDQLQVHASLAYGISRVVAAGLVLAMAAMPSLPFTKSRPWLSLIGTTAAASYSTYLLHQVVVFHWVAGLKPQLLGFGVQLFWLYVALSLALGYLSYQVLEKPLINLRRRLVP